MHKFIGLLTSIIYIGMFSASMVQAQAQTPINADDVVINGESFFAASNIASELTRLALEDGNVGQCGNFKQIAVSGAKMSQIVGFYSNCNPKPLYLVTDGGLTDMMMGCGDTPTADCSIIKNVLNQVRQYIDEMKAGGTKRFLWIRYADPQGKQWATLKANLDVLMPEIENLCRASTDPQCLWVDLRPVWVGHYSRFTSDGIHSTAEGGAATAAALWKAMMESNFLDLSAPMKPYTWVPVPDTVADSELDQNDSIEVVGDILTKIEPSKVVINGESFFSASNIYSELSRLAREEGILVQGDNFKQIAVSGANMSYIVDFYSNCNPKPLYLITDGGLMDMMMGCGDTPTVDCSIIKNVLNQVRQYIDEMKAGGTKRFIWIRYADPQGNQWATLKANLDVLMPEIENLCRASLDPKCLWVDLRPIWEGHYNQYTSDGIHPTASGGAATAAALWKVIKESDFFDIGNRDTMFEQPTAIIQVPCKQTQQFISAEYLAGKIHVKGNRNLSGVRVFDVQGRMVFSWKAATGSVRDCTFPTNRSVKGIYLIHVSGGKEKTFFRVAVP